ncbi:uncharacterized protein Dana_GF17330 [Drosophila ananassae]|uniref:Uncharacterized protein n=1 Tax=Drosophila ananassae TaxID=7217 RepID=B3LYB6_DROAN|nr:axoneme-associated protein mst101(3) [Drosophila ananassae]EDV41779.2 uncharacterized protein Dana_GF17330 [Drosophila ananassae]
MSSRTAFSLGKYSKLCFRATKRLFHPSTCMYPKPLQQQIRILRKPHDSQKKDQNGIQMSPCLPKLFTFPGELVWKTAVPEVRTPNILEGQDAYLKDLKVQQPTCSKKCGGGDDLKKKCEALAAKDKCAKPKKKKKNVVCEKGGKSELEKKCYAFARLKKCRKLNTNDEGKSKKEKDVKSKKSKGKDEKCKGKKDKETIEKEMCAKLAQEAKCKKMAEQAKKAKKGKDSKSKEKLK